MTNTTLIATNSGKTFGRVDFTPWMFWTSTQAKQVWFTIAQCNYADPCLQQLNTSLDQPRLLISMFCESTDLCAIPSFRVKIAVARYRWSQKTSLICRSLSPCIASEVQVACQEPCGECPNLNLIEPKSHKQTEETTVAHLKLTFAFSWFSSFLLNSP